MDPFSQKPLVTFIVDHINGKLAQLKQTIDSILAQQDDQWEVLIIAPHHESILEMKQDPRITFITKPTNLLDIASGDFLVFCQSGDQFWSAFLTRFYQAIAKGYRPDVVYTDCEVQQEGSKHPKPLFKPGKVSPELMYSVNYLSRALIKADAIRTINRKVPSDQDLMAQEYDILLRLYENNLNFHHLPYFLLSQNDWATLLNQKNLVNVLSDHLHRVGLSSISNLRQENCIQIKWKTPNPAVSIVILTKNHYALLKTLLESISSQSYDQEYEIILVDNNSDDSKVLNYYCELEKVPNLQIVPYPKPFNYSEAINLGVSQASFDFVLLLNDDMQVASPGWLSELSQWALRPEIGVVGAKLIRSNHIIQHMGIIMGLVGFVGHIYLNAPEHYHGLWGSSDWYRNVIAVTGACQMMRRKVFDQVGGYNTDYRIAFGDIDFCRRVNELGYRNLVTPFAKLYHYEGQTRGYVTPIGDILKGYEEFAPYLLEDDPYFSPNLTYTRIPRCMLKASAHADRLAQIEARKQFYLKKDRK